MRKVQRKVAHGSKGGDMNKKSDQRNKIQSLKKMQKDMNEIIENKINEHRANLFEQEQSTAGTEAKITNKKYNKTDSLAIDKAMTAFEESGGITSKRGKNGK